MNVASLNLSVSQRYSVYRRSLSEHRQHASGQEPSNSTIFNFFTTHNDSENIGKILYIFISIFHTSCYSLENDLTSVFIIENVKKQFENI